MMKICDVKRWLYAAFFCCAAVASAEEGVTLRSSIEYALKNNEAIQAKGQAVAIARGRLKETVAPLDAAVGARLALDRTVTPIDEDDVENSAASDTILLDGDTAQSLSSRLWVEKLFKFGLDAKVSLVSDRTNEKYGVAKGSIPVGREYAFDPAARTYAGADVELSLPILKAFDDSLAAKNIAAAGFYLEQQELELEDLIGATILDVADAYWNYAVAFMQHRALEESASRLRSREKNLAAMVAAGVASKTETIWMKANIARKDTDIILAKAALQTAFVALARLMGLPADRVAEPAPPADVFPEGLVVADAAKLVAWEDGRVRRAVLDRPSIKALQKQVDIAETRMAAAGIASRPDIEVFASAGYRGTVYDDAAYSSVAAFTENVRGLDYSVGVLFNLSVPNNKTGTYDACVAQHRQAALNLDAGIRNAIIGTRQAFANYADYLDALRNALEVVRLHASLIEGEQKRFDAGLITVDDLYGLEEQYVMVRSQFYASFRAYLTTVLNLKYYVGSLVGIDDARRNDFSIERLYRMPELAD